MKPYLLLFASLFLFVNGTNAQKKKKEKKSETTVIAAPSGLTINGTAILRKIPNEPEVAFDYKQVNAPLPKFSITNKDNENITKSVLESEGNLFLIMFNPTCEHCEDQTMEIVANIFLFKKSKVLMVASEVQTPMLSYFDANTKFSQYPSTITVSIDSAQVIKRLFNYQALPQVNIYDGKSHRLLKTFEGHMPLDSLKVYAQ